MNKPGVLHHHACGVRQEICRQYGESAYPLGEHRRELRQGIHHNQKLTRAWASTGLTLSRSLWSKKHKTCSHGSSSGWTVSRRLVRRGSI